MNSTDLATKIKAGGRVIWTKAGAEWEIRVFGPGEAKGRKINLTTLCAIRNRVCLIESLRAEDRIEYRAE